MNGQARSLEANADRLLKFRGVSRLPMVVQNEVAECGLACLAMLACYNGHRIDLSGLRRKFSISSHGTSLKDLMSMAVKLHFAPRALRAEPGDLTSIQLPCILHWSMNHFVVLREIKNHRYVLHDPAFGVRVIDEESFKNDFTGVVLELIPTPEFRHVEEKRSLKINHFWSSITGFKRNVLQVVTLSFLLQLFGIAAPLFMQMVVDDVLLRNDKNLLAVLAIGFSLLMLIQVGTSTLRSYIVLHFSNRLGIQMSANLFRQLIALPMDYFAKRHMGDIVSRFASLESVRNLLTTSLISAIVDGVMAILTLAAMFLYSAQMSVVVLTFVIIYGLLRWAMYGPSQSLTQGAIIAGAKEQTHFMESVRAIQTIKLFQQEQDRQHQWLNRLASVMNKNIDLARWGIGFTALYGLLFGLENIVGIYIGATAVMSNVMSLGMLYGFMSYKNNFIGSMDRLVTQWMGYKMLDLHLDRLADIAFTDVDKMSFNAQQANQFSSISKSDADSRAAIISGKISVEGLSYKYGESDAFVFRNVSFVIEPGETVAIIGPSGCGKTTLLKCLMGFIEPNEGQVYVDGKPLQMVPLYRENISAVMQDEQLLTGDIADNIACFASNIDSIKLEKCAKLAGVYEEIKKMPMGFNTFVGDMGSGLSGGQKQRVVLARALYREPKIIFLDEATSSLDVAAETIVNRNIKELNITRVIVAHRPETIASADRFIDLRDYSQGAV